MRRSAIITLTVAVPYTAAGLALDRLAGQTGQLTLGLTTTTVLVLLLRLWPRRVGTQTLALVAVATVGEVIGSLVWGLYTYRLENLPVFVPAGHGVVFLSGVALKTLVGRRAPVLLWVAVSGAAVWGLAGVTVLPATDVAGAIGCAALIVVLLLTRSPLYAGVFVAVAALELYGTAVGTWRWQETVPGLGLAQGNPPSGAASGYVVFDVVALWLVSVAGRGLARWRQRYSQTGTFGTARIVTVGPRSAKPPSTVRPRRAIRTNVPAKTPSNRAIAPKPALLYRDTICFTEVRPTTTPVAVLTPRVNESVRSLPPVNSADPVRPPGALGPAILYVTG